MGTSGAFGGSDTEKWRKVREVLDSAQVTDISDIPLLVPELPDGLPDKPGDGDTAPSTAGDLIAALLAAIQSDDPAIKPSKAPVPTVGDSGLFYGTMVGNGRLRGTSTAAPTSGRRQIAAASSKAGRAIGAGYALFSGNGPALEQYGLSIATLAGQGRISQILAILGAVEAGTSGPDDVALRAAVVRELNRMCDEVETNGTPPPPEESVRAVMCEYILELVAIEVEAWGQKNALPPERVIQCEAGVESYVRAAMGLLNLSEAQLLTPDQFAHAASEVLRAALAILPKGSIS